MGSKDVKGSNELLTGRGSNLMRSQGPTLTAHAVSSTTLLVCGDVVDSFSLFGKALQAMVLGLTGDEILTGALVLCLSL